MNTRLFLLFSALCTLFAAIGLLRNSTLLPTMQSELHQPRIYAYRDWQSLGIMVNPGDRVTIQADGAWYYTPRDYRGPEGHPRYLAPDFYPVPGVRGGALIGRIGEDGTPFYVGADYTIMGDTPLFNESSSLSRVGGIGGMLYLRIDDDILSDNAGSVTVDVKVAPATPVSR